MKVLVLSLSFVIAASAALTIDVRHKRDAFELPTVNYLPPEPKLDLPVAEAEIAETEPQNQQAEPQAVADSAALAENGYEYRAVRRLLLRNRSRRDVSHLNLEYLPPVAPQQPSKEYLPPTTPAPAKPTNEYLPPAVQNFIAETEAPVIVVEDTEAPEIVTEIPAAPTTTEAIATEAPEAETAVLAADGYHYKKPDVVPDLTPSAPVTGEYLPPLQAGVVEAEGPGEETSVLADDGYHFRAIKRVRF